jgi:hypothetical protein
LQTNQLMEQQVFQESVAADHIASETLVADRSQTLVTTAMVDHGAGAAAEILQSLAAALSEEKLVDFAMSLQNMLQSVDAGDFAAVAAAAAKLQTALASAGPPTLAPASTALPPHETRQSLAAAPSGEMAGATSVALTDQKDQQAPQAAEWLAALMTAPPAASLAQPVLDIAANPLLQIYQMSLLLGVRTTLDKLRVLRDDHMAVLPIFALGERGFHEDGRNDE